MAIPLSDFKALLERVKNRTKPEDVDIKEGVESVSQALLQNPQTTHVDLTNLHITPASLSTKEGVEEAIETLGEVVATPVPVPVPVPVPATPLEQKLTGKPLTGVAANVELNAKQREFVETLLNGEDCCLIGAAGTGKTTATGKAITALVEAGSLQKLGVETKWLLPDVPGILITSFTRKAVNNIKRAVPQELKPHVLTIHKTLEFAPVFYEIENPDKPGEVKKTMRFEPQRTALNPLPSGLTHIIYEETSMIGTELYDMMSAATPHGPQEIFIGDICQLPPIFGPAILGFKMSLLPVIQLTEVYRQALQSPIIRLAHAILSGDARKFDPKVVLVDKAHEATGKIVKDFKVIPALEAFNESGEHGSVKIQVWQKKLNDEVGVAATIQQFIAWEKTGYYNPEKDIILCPFNKSFGTIELNKGIQGYLGRKRGALVHQIIAGFNTHYYAIGDRVLYDKEDAVIVDIRKNMAYFGKPTMPPSKFLDRHGAPQEAPAGEEETLEEDSDELDEAALNKFLEMTDDEERVNQASHAIDIQFTYSEERMTLSSAGEVNALLGGNALTVHKMQGSEEGTIFLVLHNSHATMISNELLYTAVTRARTKLHVICEIDTFYKGVKTHKVRGVTLEEKIESFKGKVEFKVMQQEMELLRRQREQKRAIILEREARRRKEDERKKAEMGKDAMETQRKPALAREQSQEVFVAPEILQTTASETIPDVSEVTSNPPKAPEQTTKELTKEEKLAALKAKLKMLK